MMTVVVDGEAGTPPVQFGQVPVPPVKSLHKNGPVVIVPGVSLAFGGTMSQRTLFGQFVYDTPQPPAVVWVVLYHLAM